MNLHKLQEMMRDREVWYAVVCEIAEFDMTLWLNNKKQLEVKIYIYNWFGYTFNNITPIHRYCRFFKKEYS